MVHYWFSQLKSMQKALMGAVDSGSAAAVQVAGRTTNINNHKVSKKRFIVSFLLRYYLLPSADLPASTASRIAARCSS
jgi:hypothetical protein